MHCLYEKIPINVTLKANYLTLCRKVKVFLRILVIATVPDS